jgi:hypothetical protein
MMKKLGMFAFVMALVVAFALPAFAFTVEGAKGERVIVFGSIRYDVGYRGTNSDYNNKVNTTYGTDERVNFFTGLSQSTNIGAKVILGNLSATVILTTQSSTENYHKQVNDRSLNSPYSLTSNSWAVTGFNQVDNAIVDSAYATYTFGNSTLTFGKTTTPLTVVQTPAATLGYTLGAGNHIVGIAYGFVYDNDNVPTLTFSQNINKTFNYTIGIMGTGTYAENVGTGSTIVIRESYAQFPSIAARFGLNFGVVNINPGFRYQQVKWNNLPAGFDDTMDAWYFRLPVRLTFGPFTALLEGLYGQNIGGDSSAQTMASSEPAGYKRLDGKIKNATTLNYWFDLSYKVGPATPHVYAGWTISSNDDFYKTGDSSSTRSIMGLNLYYEVTPNFKVIPEFSIYDLGRIQGQNNNKLGGDWLGGVQFQFNF